MSLGSHGRREPVPSSDVDSGMAWRDVPEHDPLTSGPRRALASSQTARYMQRDRRKTWPTASGCSAGASTRTG